MINSRIADTTPKAVFYYTGAPVVGIARWSVPRIGQGHLEVKWYTNRAVSSVACQYNIH